MFVQFNSDIDNLLLTLCGLISEVAYKEIHQCNIIMLFSFLLIHQKQSITSIGMKIKFSNPENKTQNL